MFARDGGKRKILEILSPFFQSSLSSAAFIEAKGGKWHKEIFCRSSSTDIDHHQFIRVCCEKGKKRFANHFPVCASHKQPRQHKSEACAWLWERVWDEIKHEKFSRGKVGQNQQKNTSTAVLPQPSNYLDQKQQKPFFPTFHCLSRTLFKLLVLHVYYPIRVQFFRLGVWVELRLKWNACGAQSADTCGGISFISGMREEGEKKKRFFNPQIDMKSDFLRTCRGGVSRRHRRIYFHATVVIKNNDAPPLNGFKLKWKLLIR